MRYRVGQKVHVKDNAIAYASYGAGIRGKVGTIIATNDDGFVSDWNLLYTVNIGDGFPWRLYVHELESAVLVDV